jgi:hypothetical protein
MTVPFGEGSIGDVSSGPSRATICHRRGQKNLLNITSAQSMAEYADFLEKREN